MDQAFQHVDRSLDRGLNDLHLVLGDCFQHIVCRILSRCRTPDSYFEPHKLRSPHCLDDRLDAVMAAVSAGLFDPEPAWFQIQIVVDENQIVDGERNSRRRPLSGEPVMFIQSSVPASSIS